jgi:hypothetical protein
MSNIHLIPTDKPSRLKPIRLKQNKITKEYSLVVKGIDLTSYIPINIYITGEESSKEGDWHINSGGCLFKDEKHLGIYLPLDTDKKIILTTDDQLIKDGVQAIDDTFLEWFVKNPSCEVVEVEPIPNSNWGFDIAEPITLGYKIIIPKEEPKQETLYTEEQLRTAMKYASEITNNKMKYMEDYIQSLKK